MRALIFRPLHASPSKPADAGEFKREAERFGFYLLGEGWDVTIQTFDNTLPKPQRRKPADRVIASGTWDMVALFGHGMRASIQTGHDMGSIPALAALLAEHSARPLRVELYACDAARDADRDKRDDVRDAVGGDGGFADVLRDALSTLGITGHVDAHAKSGHTAINPHVRRFHMDGTGAAAGAGWLVDPKGPHWRAWRAALKGDMRFRFPLMTAEEIAAAL